MRPVDFAGSNTVFAKNQPEYLPLSAKTDRDPRGTVTSCWALSWRERLTVLWRGRLFLRQLTFGSPLQPIRPFVLEDTR